MQTPVLNTTSLILRPIAPDDAPCLFRHFGNWNVIQFLSKSVPWPYTERDAADFINNSAMPSADKGEAFVWAITPKPGPDRNRLVGMIDYRLLPNPLGNRGFWMSEIYQGRGWMSEAVVATQDYVFFEYGIDEIIVSNGISNPASRRLKEKYGAEFLGTTTLDHHNCDSDSETWRITRGHWARIRGQIRPAR